MKGSTTIDDNYKQRAPAIFGIVRMCETILKKETFIPKRLATYSPVFYDGVVPHTDMVVDGANNKTLFVPRHTTAIVASLVFVLPFY